MQNEAMRLLSLLVVLGDYFILLLHSFVTCIHVFMFSPCQSAQASSSTRMDAEADLDSPNTKWQWAVLG